MPWVSRGRPLSKTDRSLPLSFAALLSLAGIRKAIKLIVYTVSTFPVEIGIYSQEPLVALENLSVSGSLAVV